MGLFSRSTPDPPDSNASGDAEISHACTCGDSFSTANELISHAQSVHNISVD